MNPFLANRRRGGWPIGALAAAFAITWLRILLVERLPDRGFFVKYVQFADEILAGHVPAARLGDVSPGYLWTMLALRFAGLRPHDVIILQIAAVTLAALALSVCAGRIAGPVAALATAVLLLANRAALVCATELEPETLILLVSSIGLAAFTASATNGKKSHGDSARTPGASMRGIVLAGLAFGFSAICRPVALAGIAALALWLWHRRRKGAAIWFFASAAVPVVLVVALNAALSGDALIMDPGTVFYEGMNPLASGYAGVQPRIVNDLEATSREPDFLHVAYRIVAARATRMPMNRAASNHYWSAKAWSFVRYEPAAAVRLALRKLLLACGNYDAYDLATMVRKSDAMRGLPWAPFGFLLALGMAALLIRRDSASEERGEFRQTVWSSGGAGSQNGDSSSAPVVLFTLANGVTLIAFYVTARIRAAVIPGLVVLAAIGVARLIGIAGTDRRRALLIALLVVTAASILSLEGDAQREDRYGWSASFRAGEAARAAQAAAAHGAKRQSAVLQAVAASWRPADPTAVDPRLLAAVAREGLKSEARPERRFDLAIALQDAGDWLSSAKVLDDLAAAGYRPRRENRAVSSVAFYQARAAEHLGSRELARARLAIAMEEAPGDPYVLALRVILDPPGSATAIAAQRELDALHDPFTAALAVAAARADAGDRAGASATLQSLVRAFPEWPRPRVVALAAGGETR